MKISIFALSAIILCAHSLSISYEEKIEEVQERLNYYNEKTQEVTKGKILFRYSNETGLYCEAATDIEKKEYIFLIKNDYIISFCKNDLLII
jgi:tyrosine-protein phosphatase YwqE